MAALIEAAQGCVLVLLDTLTAVWTGDEEDNHEIATFDREIMARLVRETGASVLVLDHTGHPQRFVRRQGVSAPREASSKGQKTDAMLEFRAQGPAEFTIVHGKNRMGGHKEPERRFRVVDTEDGGLDIEMVEPITAEAEMDPAELETEAVRLVAESPGMFTKTSLAQGLGRRTEESLGVVTRLLRQGRIGPEKDRAKLYVIAEASEPERLL